MCQTEGANQMFQVGFLALQDFPDCVGRAADEHAGLHEPLHLPTAAQHLALRFCNLFH